MIINVPVIGNADILVVGFSTGGVEAALAARVAGKSVFMIGSDTYPGVDVGATARYWLEPDQTPRTPLSRSLFGDTPDSAIPLRPMDVKYGLETAMRQAGVSWLYLTWPACLLRDGQGRVAGLVVVNRSGFQAILAGAIIDTTERAVVGSMTSATFRPFPAGRYVAQRIVVGAEDRPSALGSDAHTLPGFYEIGGRRFAGVVHELEIEMVDASPQAWARAEVQARLKTWHPGQIFASDRLIMLPPDRLDSGHGVSVWTGPDAVALEALRGGLDEVYVLGPRSDLAAAAMHEFLKPCNLMAVGARLGALVAETAVAPSNDIAVFPAYPADAVDGVDGVRHDTYFRFDGQQGIPFDLNRFRDFGAVEVVVAGGGTGGAPAGIAAGRAGARTVILEVLPGLGGVGTEGRIASYWFGNRCGFTAEIDHGVERLAADPEFLVADGKWNSEWKKAWYLREADAAGAEVWFGSGAVAAVMRDGRVGGVIAVTPCGLGILRAGAVVDATGNADVAAAAGAQTVSISKANVAVQGTGLAPVQPGKHYQNTDYTFVDDADVMDVTRAFVMARHKFRDFFDLAQMVDSRQRRQVVGEISLDPLDFLAGRTFPDTVVTACSNFDSHGFTIHPVFMAKAPDHGALRAHVPFRCLKPAGLDGVLVTGLGVSSHRDALPVIRMQPDVQNQGYAAGRAAAMVARAGTGFSRLDIRGLQRHLVENGILEAGVLMHGDSFPLPQSAVAEAVDSGLDSHLGLAVIFGQPAESIPLLRKAYAGAEGPRKTRCAHLLGLLGDDAGIATLMDYVDAHPWDTGWNYRGMGQFGFSLSEIDSMLVALGRSGNRAVVPVLLRKAAALGEDAEFSHFRALTLAFETLPTPAAAAHFERFLKTVQGGAHQTLDEQLRDVPASDVDTTERNRELRELLLARGLFACGDPHGLARQVLEAYGRDLHGHYARHARSLLAAE